MLVWEHVSKKQPGLFVSLPGTAEPALPKQKVLLLRPTRELNVLLLPGANTSYASGCKVTNLAFKPAAMRSSWHPQPSTPGDLCLAAIQALCQVDRSIWHHRTRWNLSLALQTRIMDLFLKSSPPPSSASMSLMEKLFGGVFWQQERRDDRNSPFSNLTVPPPPPPALMTPC